MVVEFICLFLLIAAGLLVVLAAVAVTAIVIVRRSPHDAGEQGATFPTLVDTAASSGEVSTVSASYWGGELLLVRLSEGQAGQQSAESLPLAQGEPLSAEEIAAILARLPELAAEPEDQLDFLLPTDSPPPPRPGQTVKEDFPPPPVVVTPELCQSKPSTHPKAWNQ